MPLQSGEFNAVELNPHLRRLLIEGKKIEAIAVYRRFSNASLVDAKNYVEGLERDTEFDVSENMPDVERLVIAHLERGEKIQAIKVYRDHTSTGLLEAKNYVEAVERRLGLASPARAGCASMAILLMLAAGVVALTMSGKIRADDRPESVGENTAAGTVHVHMFESEFQKTRTEVRVLLPQPFETGKKYPVVYILPVEAGRESRFGDGLTSILEHNLHKKHPAVYVAPTFSELPWYADHPSRKNCHQESYLLHTVLPFIEQSYPVIAGAEGRLLLGFSKSGWGAWSLLLRNPDVFHRAVAWDAPLMMSKPDRFGMNQVFESQAGFEPYQISSLLKNNSRKLGTHPRLILLGYGNFREHHVQTHNLLNEMSIPHVYRDGPYRKHVWQSGWVDEALPLLLDPIHEG